MDNLGHFTNVGETLQALNRQLQEGVGMMRDDKLELRRLHDENQQLEGLLEQERQRSRSLTEERDELLRQIKRFEDPPAPGFTVIPTWHPSFRDKHGVSSSLQAGSALSDSVDGFKFKPKIDAVHVKIHIWSVSGIESAPVKDEPASSDHVLPGEYSGREEISTEVKKETCRTEVVANHEHTSGSIVPSIEISSGRSSPLQAIESNNIPVRIPGQEPPAKRQRLDSDEMQQHCFARRGKPVCVSCWTTGSSCDFNAQCNACRSQGIKCVRVLCRSDLKCRKPRCHRLHTGDWDKEDPGWIVQEGALPKRRPRRPRTADSYWPSYSEESGRRDG